MTISGVVVTISAKGNEITPKMRKYLEKADAEKGTKVYFESIWSKGPEGRARRLALISLKVI